MYLCHTYMVHALPLNTFHLDFVVAQVSFLGPGLISVYTTHACIQNKTCNIKLLHSLWMFSDI